MADETLSTAVDTFLLSSNTATMRSSMGANDASNLTAGTLADARVTETNVTQHEAAVNHDSLMNFSANEHVDHTSVVLTAGSGLSGGGNIATSRSFSVDFADASEVNTGTEAAKSVTPDALAGSAHGTKIVQITCFDYTTNVATGNGAGYILTPAAVNGMDLVAVHAEVITAGTTGTTNIQIANVTDSVDMLSTVLTIDSGETGSDTAATPAVINTSSDDVATYDLLRIDVDAVSTTPPQGLIVTLEFRLP